MRLQIKLNNMLVFSLVMNIIHKGTTVLEKGEQKTYKEIKLESILSKSYIYHKNIHKLHEDKILSLK